MSVPAPSEKYSPLSPPNPEVSPKPTALAARQHTGTSILTGISFLGERACRHLPARAECGIPAGCATIETRSADGSTSSNF